MTAIPSPPTILHRIAFCPDCQWAANHSVTSTRFPVPQSPQQYAQINQTQCLVCGRQQYCWGPLKPQPRPT